MKFKYYLRGAGIGLIVASVILMIAFSKHNIRLTDDEIIARAKELGMVMEDSSVDNKNDSSKDNQDNNEDPSNEDDPEGNTGDDNDGDNNTGGNDNNDDNNENGDDDNDGKDRTLVEFVIRNGEFSDVVSNHLYEKGLIDDPVKFNEWLIANRFDKMLETGTFMIPKNSTYEEIVKILTTKE